MLSLEYFLVLTVSLFAYISLFHIYYLFLIPVLLLAIHIISYTQGTWANIQIICFKIIFKVIAVRSSAQQPVTLTSSIPKNKVVEWWSIVTSLLKTHEQCWVISDNSLWVFPNSESWRLISSLFWLSSRSLYNQTERITLKKKQLCRGV
jgi:hypothetical protein